MMAYVTQERCYICKKLYTTVNHKPNLCPDCYPQPKKEEFHCPGCCVCKGGWIPESERRY